MPSPQESAQSSSPDSILGRTRRRRLPSQAEQERRQAWGKEWGKAGKALNRRIRESG